PIHDPVGAWVTADATSVHLVNRQMVAWQRCYLELDSAQFKDSYSYYTAVVRVGDSVNIPILDFTSASHQNPTAESARAEDLTVSCQYVAGKDGWNVYKPLNIAL
ncbi:hypothetical protein KGQ71_05160, partial [Patescibacteria group bacterium]|nr:hypothetical protein [Patescibacteria group bacterium]